MLPARADPGTRDVTVRRRHQVLEDHDTSRRMTAPDHPPGTLPSAEIDLRAAALLEPLTALVIEAGAAILAIRQRAHGIETKTDGSPVTEADLAADRIIAEGLARLAPDIPSLSEVLPRIEKSGLLVTDIEILRLHYAETVKHWRERFLAHREEVERIYDQRFVRMWEFYLAASEMSFREQNMMVFQIQMTKRQDVVPITRDYIMREEQRFRTLDDKRTAPLRLAVEEADQD